MNRFVLDCGVVLRLASEEREIHPDHELLARTLLRSQTLSALHEAVHRGELDANVAIERVARIAAIPIRLLRDAVLRRNAWRIATIDAPDRLRGNRARFPLRYRFADQSSLP